MGVRCFNCGEECEEVILHLGQPFCSEQCAQEIDEDECVAVGGMSDDEIAEYRQEKEGLSYFDLG